MLVEVVARALGQLVHRFPLFLFKGLAGGAFGGAGALKWARFAVIGAALSGGLLLAWEQRSILDDAFISFRYAANLLEGHGLVWNPGEQVLGITNLGWTLLVTLATWVSGLELPHAALILNGLGYVALVVATEAAGRQVLGDRAPVLSAAALVAVQQSVTAFATTGLETVPTVALVVGGLALLVGGRELGAGLLLSGAVFFRLDHGLFYAAAALATLVTDRKSVVRLVAPGVVIVPAILLWQAAVYGDPLPNTFHAKSAWGWWPSQGLAYLGAFYAGSMLALVVPIAGCGLVVAWRRGQELRRLAAFVGASLLLWHVYLLMVGGDFMYGRFMIPMVPLLLLAAEVALAACDRVPWRAVLVGGCLGLTARGVPIIAPREVWLGQCDESTVYPLAELHPVRVDHVSQREGQVFHDLLAERGVRPVLAAHGIGMLGYYSGLEIVDVLGLTDATLARGPRSSRDGRRTGRPGHEKVPDQGYLEQRGVQLTEWVPWPEDLHGLTRLRARDPVANPLEQWHFYRWDPELAATLRREVPELAVPNADAWVARFVRRARRLPREEVQRTMAFLDVWYFPYAGRDDLREELERFSPGNEP